MSNCEIIDLGPPIEVQVFQLREVLRCILHTILFHRTLGALRPVDVDSELLDITYVTCGDAGVSRVVEDRISDLYSWLEKHKDERECKVSLSFYEKRQKAAWFAKSEERLYWEQWRVHFSLLRPGGRPLSSSASSAVVAAAADADAAEPTSPDGSRQPRPPPAAPATPPPPPPSSLAQHGSAGLLPSANPVEALQRATERCLLRVVEVANEKRDHIPPVVTSGVVSFPFEIALPAEGGESFYGMDMLKRLMVTRPPGLLA